MNRHVSVAFCKGCHMILAWPFLGFEESTLWRFVVIYVSRKIPLRIFASLAGYFPSRDARMEVHLTRFSFFGTIDDHGAVVGFRAARTCIVEHWPGTEAQAGRDGGSCTYNNRWWVPGRMSLEIAMMYLAPSCHFLRLSRQRAAGT